MTNLQIHPKYPWIQVRVEDNDSIIAIIPCNRCGQRNEITEKNYEVYAWYIKRLDIGTLTGSQTTCNWFGNNCI